MNPGILNTMASELKEGGVLEEEGKGRLSPALTGLERPYGYLESVEFGSEGGGLLSTEPESAAAGTGVVLHAVSWREYLRQHCAPGGALDGCVVEAQRAAEAAEFMAVTKVGNAAQTAREASERARFDVCSLEMLATCMESLAMQLCVAARSSTDAAEAAAISGIGAAVRGHATALASTRAAAERRTALLASQITQVRQQAWREILIAQAAITRKAVDDADVAVLAVTASQLPLPPTDVSSLFAARAVRDALVGETTFSTLQQCARRAGVVFDAMSHLPPPPPPRQFFPPLTVDDFRSPDCRPTKPATQVPIEPAAPPISGVVRRRRPGRPRRR